MWASTSNVLDDLFNMCLQEFVFSRSLEGLIWSACIKGLPQKTTTLLVIFLWLLKSLKNLHIISLLMTSKNVAFFCFHYNFRSYWSTVDLVSLIELLRLLIDLMLVKLQHLIDFWIRLDRIMDWMGSCHKNEVPQSPILDSTLFLPYINDLLDDCICNVAIYADDITLYSKLEQYLICGNN